MEQPIRNGWIEPISNNYYGWKLPELNLNNIFEYAIPKLQNEGYQIDIVCHEHKGFTVVIDNVIEDFGIKSKFQGDDLGLALFGAIWEVIK